MKEITRISEDLLEQVSGGSGWEKKYCCVEGDSKIYGGNVKLYVSTYNDAVKLCEKDIRIAADRVNILCQPLILFDCSCGLK